MPSAFSSPPIRCSSPGVPGTAHGRASVSGSRAYGQERPLVGGFVTNSVEMSGSDVGVRDPPRLGAVREVRVGEQVDRRPVLERDPRGLDRHVEAVARGRAASTGTGDSELRPYRTMSRSACSGFVGIPVDGPARWTSMISERQLERDGEPDRLRLQHDPGPGGRRQIPSAPPNEAPSADADGRDLVLGLERAHAEVLVARELLEDPGGGRDRVRAEEERQPALDARPRRARSASASLPVMLRYVPGGELRRLDLVRDEEVLARLAVVARRP